MSKRQTYLKKILLGFILVVWLLPFYQDRSPFVKFKKLEGWVNYAPDDTLTKAKWFNGSYTQKKENYIKEQFGLRNFFLRLRNQVFYSLLNVPTAKGVVIGKGGMLYEEKYIASYMGQDFIGEQAIREKAEKIKFVTETLKKMNIDLVLCLAPGKPDYYPEFIPDMYFKNSDTVNTNYKWAARIFKEAGLNVIDYNALFKSLKSKTKFPLYPKTGVHWSVYGAEFAFDSLTRYIEKLKGRELRHFMYNKIVWSDSMREQDEDIGLALNTLYDVEHFKMAYPVIEYKDTAGKYQPRSIIISDSYWTNIHQLWLPRNIFRTSQYWYFYNQHWGYGDEATATSDPLYYNLKERIENSDVIIIMATEPHIVDIGWGFIDEAYELYKTGAFRNREKTLQFLRFKTWMRTESKLMFELKERSKKENIPFETLLDSEAHKMLGDVKEEPLDSKDDYRLNEVMRFNIQNNAGWLRELNLRAASEKKPLEEVIVAEIKAITGIKALVQLKASNDKFLCADAAKNNLVLASGNGASISEKFTFLPLKNNECVITSFAYKFLSAELGSKGEITATRDLFNGWEKFTLERIGNDFIALKAANGKYLSLDEKSGQILAIGPSIGKNEKFKVSVSQ
jgi:hypothetical protein